MVDPAPAVALLFDDDELGSQLRTALQEHGALIVHEGGVASLSRALLQESGADVVVVNLEDGGDDAIDALYDLIDGDRPRVVFNDGQASRALEGWDRARWARHLAAKVMANGDVDVPRPAPSRALPLAVAPIEAVPVVDDDALEVPDGQPPAVTGLDETGAVAASAEPFFADDATAEGVDVPPGGESESLAAELEALLASEEMPVDVDDAGAGLHAFSDVVSPSFFDGDSTAVAGWEAPVDELPVAPDGGTQAASDATLSLLPVDAPSLDAAAGSDPGETTAAVIRAPESWTLVDDEAATIALAQAGQPAAAAFGVEKQSAADFLAPSVEDAAPLTEPVMNLQLVTMEEAVAPQRYEHEFVLNEVSQVLERVVLLGASVEGLDSVRAFLAALPVATRLTFLHTQHLAARPAMALVDALAECSGLPVRLAAQGVYARAGEILVAPAEQQVYLRRDGSIELQAVEATNGHDPSIDANFSNAAATFGRDAVAIVFAGQSTDAIAGAQAIHDSGGQVWVESSADEHVADMVGGILAERLVSYSGTPQALAAHLIEVFS